MKKNLLLSFTLAPLALFAAATPGFDSPESICTDGAAYFVSNVGVKLAPSEKDGDGRIARVDAQGKVLDARFLPTGADRLDAPKGMAIVDGVLYVTDIDRLVGFSLKSRAQVFELSFAAEKTLFLNDITAGRPGELFVSATDVNRVYRVKLGAGAAYEALRVDGLKGPNGLVYCSKCDGLVVVGFGTGGKPNGRIGMIKDVSAKSYYAELAGEEGYFDGVALLAGGKKLLVSDWVGFGEKQGVLRVLDIETGKFAPPVVSGIGGPADFLYESKTNMLRLPHMMEGVVGMTELKLP